MLLPSFDGSTSASAAPEATKFTAKISLPNILPSDGPVFFEVIVRHEASGIISTSKHRYSEFEALQKKLWFRHRMPELPPRSPKPGYEIDLLRQRALRLEAWVVEVLCLDSILSEPDLIAFFALPEAVRETNQQSMAKEAMSVVTHGVEGVGRWFNPQYKFGDGTKAVLGTASGLVRAGGKALASHSEAVDYRFPESKRFDKGCVTPSEPLPSEAVEGFVLISERGRGYLHERRVDPDGKLFDEASVRAAARKGTAGYVFFKYGKGVLEELGKGGTGGEGVTERIRASAVAKYVHVWDRMWTLRARHERLLDDFLHRREGCEGREDRAGGLAGARLGEIFPRPSANQEEADSVWAKVERATPLAMKIVPFMPLGAWGSTLRAGFQLFT